MLSLANQIFNPLRLILLTSVIFAAAGIASSQEADFANYALKLQNLQVGNVTFTHKFDATNYDVSFKFETTGLAGALFDTAAFAQTIGTGAKFGVYFPQTAHFDMLQMDQETTQDMSYEDGLLTSIATSPRQFSTLKPEDHAGAVDPLTAIAYILRPVPFERLCKINVRVFDGIVATRVALNQPSQRPDGRYQCQGGYAREFGFEAEKLEAEGKSFYFTALYRVDRDTGNMIVDRIVGDSIFGRFELIRQ